MDEFSGGARVGTILGVWWDVGVDTCVRKVQNWHGTWFSKWKTWTEARRVDRDVK